MARHLLALWLVALGGLLIGLGAGCTSQGEVRLWPILDVERPDSDGGAHVEFLWPIVEVDGTRPAATSYAVRPLLSYDSGAEKGSFLWPFGSFGWQPHPYLGLWPLYSWRKWDSASESGGHWVLPLGGYWHKPGKKRWVWGPGLYVRQRSSDDPNDKLDATLIPPMIYSRNEGRYSLLLANYYQYRAPRGTGTVFFPFVWWQEFGDRDLATPEARWTRNRALFPIVGWHRVESQQGMRSTRADVLWPLLLTLQWGPDAGWSQVLAYMISWRYQDGELRYLNLLPVYSRGPTHFAIPILGFCRWDSTGQGEAEPGRRDRKGWALWPWVSHRMTLDGENQATIVRDRWIHLAGFVRSETRPLDGFRRLDPLYPLVSYESGPARRAHRFWPLYRYSETESGTNFHALGELISTQHGQEISEGPHVVLRPFTYQSTVNGDHRLRLFWKLFESSRRGDDRRWGLHPLLYSRSSPEESSTLFLGGLLGHVRDDDGGKLRLLWFFDL